MGELSIWHWLIVAAVVVLLFGSRKLPDAARSMGRSLRIFRSEMRELNDDRAEAGPAPPTLIDAPPAERPANAPGDSATGRPADHQTDQSTGTPPPQTSAG